MEWDTPLAVECLFPEGLAPTNVASSVNAAGEWDWSQLTRALFVHYLCLISVVQPPNMAFGDDSVGWRWEDNDMFITGVMYDILPRVSSEWADLP
ncbi:hypothetical protein V6N13_125456 [Hibiscus sabdariffa]